jgi:multiple sugar transport system substrate-binding protein/sn-glycerol 3-phosphate transport system substrate-binding protein
MLNELIAEFNTDNPWGLTVNASNQGGYGDIYNKVVAGLETGELPALVVAYQNQALAYLQGGGLANIDAYVNDTTWGLNEAEQADFIGAFFNQDIDPLTGTRIGFPPNRSIEVMYYNMDALEELGYDAPPATWEEFSEMVMAFVDNGWSGYEGETMGYSVRTDASNVAALTYAMGYDIYGVEEGFTYNNPGTVAALTAMQGLYQAGYVNEVVERFGDQNDFTAGKNLFYMGSSSGLPFVQAAIEESGAPFDWGVTFVPGDLQTVDVYGASVTILAGENITPEQQLAAWLFVRWFTEPEQQASWAAASNYFPVRISTAQNMSDLFAEQPQYEQAWELLLTGQLFTEPALAGYDNIRGEAQNAFVEILAGADVEATLEALDAKAEEIQAEFE